MKNMKKYLYIAIAAILAAGCSSLMEQGNESPNEVRFSTNISSFVTKGVNPDSGFENGDALSIFALEPFIVDNVKYTVVNGNTLKSDTPICWPEDITEEAYFGAIYPYKPDMSIVEESGLVFSVMTDQSTQENYRASDMLLAEAEAMPGETVNLEFRHYFTRVDITIDGELEKSIASVSLGGVANSIDLEKYEIVTERVPIKTGEIILADGTKAWSCIVIPESKVVPELIITFTDGTTSTYPVSKTVDLDSGCRYRATLSLNQDGSLKAEFVFKIFDWVYGDWIWMEPTSADWQVCGNFSDWSEQNAIPMEKVSDGVFQLVYNLPKEAEFKFICNWSWERNLGGVDYEGAGEYRTPALSGDVTVSLVSGGYNLYYPEGGKVRITLYVKDEFATIESLGQVTPPTETEHEWSIIGTIQGHNWDYDLPMIQCYEGGGYYALISYYEGEEFKLRYQDSWDINRGIYDGNGLGGHTGVQDGPNIYLPESGLFEIFFYPDDDDYLYIRSLSNLSDCAWSLIGTTMGLNWEQDLRVSAYSTDMYENPIVYFYIDYYPGEEFKFRFDNNWYLNFGMDPAFDVVPMESGCEYAIAQDGPNMTIDEPVSGRYQVGLNLYRRVVRVDRMGEIGDEELDCSMTIQIGPAIDWAREIRFQVGEDVGEVRYLFCDEQINDDDTAYNLSQLIATGQTQYYSVDNFVEGDDTSRYAPVTYSSSVSGYHTVVTAVMDRYGNWQGWYYWWFYLDAVPGRETWTSLGTGLYTEDFISSIFKAESLSWEVEVQQCNEDPSKYRMVYPYDGKYEYNDEGDWDATRSHDIEIVVKDDTHVYMLPQSTGIDWGYGMLSIASYAGYMISYGTALEEVDAADFGTLADGVITFPEKDLIANMADYSFTGWFTCNKNNAFSLVLPGYYQPSGAPMAKASARPRKVQSNLQIIK